jgi:hypothetical protein
MGHHSEKFSLATVLPNLYILKVIVHAHECSNEYAESRYKKYENAPYILTQ